MLHRPRLTHLKVKVGKDLLPWFKSDITAG
jgi:hypothetical protein